MFPDPATAKRRIPCVGALVHDDQGRLLVVRRAREPAAGRWSVPGGRVEGDESDYQAVVREVLEETSLHVVVGLRVGTVQRPGPAGTIYDIRDYACSLSVATTPVAGDDAAEVRWVTRQELRSLDLSDGLWESLSEWGMLPG
ncbi:MAG: 8-oxo-dGTP diphosphatase [Actinomycetota bacterium]|jgi:8-oxo-dGTP diphosphatase|nr:8-oxo-dGTP diphosphatase [Actinomycetota bacterium]